VKVRICKVELQAELLRSDNRLESLIILSGIVHTGVEVHGMDLEVSRLVEQPWLQLIYCAYTVPSVCCVVATSDEGKKV